MGRELALITTIFKKDLVSEFRAKESVVTMVTFSVLILVLFSMAFEPSRRTVEEILPGLIWMSLIFSGILGLNRTYARERFNDCLIGILSTPIAPYQIYLGKAASNLVQLLFVEIITFPLYFIFYDLNLKGSLGILIIIMLIGSVGFILVGTFLAALTSNLRANEALLPVILFPLLMPVLLAAIEATSAVFTGLSLDQYLPWIKLILVYDLIFLVMPLLLFDYLMEVD
ncbi:ABC transporter involved in cytochrome c biogenesis, CcmB subunit [Desulfosporosinus sp. I2]|uniref:heme exporter protein CcmB n=1 Tax=Desulfosporosinus sp. I2 TaxID=1617025 RepID=UPI0005ED6B78|nr:heme exporter protein CcmB [Desulfosporosinus sp. I2]KJR45221.1 ABC transporter involved in cytochrome c biogenesis, CcmB subunit [Desulfosporosinus sp. I2]